MTDHPEIFAIRGIRPANTNGTHTVRGHTLQVLSVAPFMAGASPNIYAGYCSQGNSVASRAEGVEMVPNFILRAFPHKQGNRVPDYKLTLPTRVKSQKTDQFLGQRQSRVRVQHTVHDPSRHLLNEHRHRDFHRK